MNYIIPFFQGLGSIVAFGMNQTFQLYQNNPYVHHYVNGSLLFFSIFLVYLETKVKGVFFRPDDRNVIRFIPFGFSGFLTYPFRSIDPWYPTNWDLNFIVFTQIGAMTYVLLKSYETSHQ